MVFDFCDFLWEYLFIYILFICKLNNTKRSNGNNEKFFLKKGQQSGLKFCLDFIKNLKKISRYFIEKYNFIFEYKSIYLFC